MKFVVRHVGFIMGELIFWKFWQNNGDAQLQNTISFELVVQSGKVRYFWKGEKARNSNLT